MNTESPDNKTTPALKSAKSHVWFKRGLTVLIFIVLFMGVRAWQQRHIVKGPAAPLSGLLLDGKPYALPVKPLQPVLIQFWATWCPVCKAEQGSIESLAHDNPNVITVALWSGDNTAVQNYMRENALTFPVLNDTDGAIAAKWGVQGVPASFIVGTDGVIRFVEIGYTTGMGLRFRLWLAGF